MLGKYTLIGSVSKVQASADDHIKFASSARGQQQTFVVGNGVRYKGWKHSGHGTIGSINSEFWCNGRGVYTAAHIHKQQHTLHVDVGMVANRARRLSLQNA